MGSPRDDVDDDGGICFARICEFLCVVLVLLLRGAASECSCSLFPSGKYNSHVTKYIKLHSTHKQSPLTVHGKEATRAWSGVVGLGGDRLEVRARRLRRGKGVV